MAAAAAEAQELELRAFVASDELLTYRVLQEEAVLHGAVGHGGTGGAAEAALPARARSVAVGLMRSLASSPTAWFAAATLVDLYHHHAPDEARVEALPAVCVAAVRLVEKSDYALATFDPTHSQHSSAAADLAQELHGAGFAVTVPGQEQVIEQEVVLLTALRWRANVPTIESWLSILAVRLDVLTEQALQPSLQWLARQGVVLGSRVLMRHAVSPGLPPRKVAAGLTGLLLARAGLLPLGALRPTALSDEAWERLAGCTLSVGGAPQCALSAAALSAVVLPALQAATGLQPGDLQEAAAMAAGALV